MAAKIEVTAFRGIRPVEGDVNEFLAEHGFELNEVTIQFVSTSYIDIGGGSGTGEPVFSSPVDVYEAYVTHPILRVS